MTHPATRQSLCRLGAMFAHDRETSLSIQLPDEHPDDEFAGKARLAANVPRGFPRIGPIAYLQCWSAEWARLAYPLIQPNHVYAAALMATAPPPDVEIRAPWPTFYLAVPPGLVTLLSREGEPEPVEGVLAYVARDRWTFVAPAMTVEYSRVCFTLDAMRAGELLDESMGPAWGDYGLTAESHDERAALCLSRLLLNACVAMSDPRVVRPIGKAHREPLPTAPRVWEMGRPVRVDCRQAVRDYIRGGSRIPAVQWLVRGHWRNQAHGPERSMRTMRWIEPYWKGADGAPLAVRDHQLNNRKQP